MAKLGWFSVVGAVAVLGTSVSYAAWTSATARSNAAAERSLSTALLDAEPAPLEALAAVRAQLPPDAPALTPAEFAPVSSTPTQRPAARRAPAQGRTEAASASAPIPPAAKPQEPRRAAAPGAAAPRTPPVPQQKAPPIVASDRGIPDTRAEPRAETKDAGAVMLAQVAKMKRTLRLAPEQQEQWAPVEAALRDIARQQTARKAQGARSVGGIALTDEDTQKLYWAAAPLIMNLREEQKRDARQLARAMGLEQVASAF